MALEHSDPGSRPIAPAPEPISVRELTLSRHRPPTTALVVWKALLALLRNAVVEGRGSTVVERCGSSRAARP